MMNMRGHCKQTRSTCERLFFLIQLSIWWSSVGSVSTELPCHFLDSINITNGISQPNKSIIFDGTVYPEGQYADIDYILNEDSDIETVKLHRRGCLCNLKPCIRFCCSFGDINGISDCETKTNYSFKSYETIILDENKKTKRVRLDQQFEIIDKKPCPAFYFEEENYQITHVSCMLKFEIQKF